MSKKETTNVETNSKPKDQKEKSESKANKIASLRSNAEFTAFNNQKIDKEKK